MKPFKVLAKDHTAEEAQALLDLAVENGANPFDCVMPDHALFYVEYDDCAFFGVDFDGDTIAGGGTDEYNMPLLTYQQAVDLILDRSEKREKVLIIGHARHGKDTVANWLRDQRGLKVQSSSWFAMTEFLFDEINDTVYGDSQGYGSYECCFEDRVNHRKFWHKAISRYNRKDKIRLAEKMMVDHDCYIGMRCVKEFLTALGYELPKWWQFWKVPTLVNNSIFDHVIWVDAMGRKPPESTASMSIHHDHLVLVPPGVKLSIVHNNGTEEELIKHLEERF